MMYFSPLRLSTLRLRTLIRAADSRARRKALIMTATTIECATPRLVAAAKPPRKLFNSDRKKDPQRDTVTDIYDAAEWTEMDLEDLKAAIEHSRSIEEIAEFLCRSESARLRSCGWYHDNKKPDDLSVTGQLWSNRL